MTTQISVKLTKRPTVKAALLPHFPAGIKTTGYLSLAIANGSFTFGADYTLLSADNILDPSKTLIAVYDEGTGGFKQMSLSSFISSTTQIDQHITSPGPVGVLPNAGIVRVDQAVGAAITLTMPLSTVKTCPVLVSDWKGDAGTHNITVSLSGTDKFPGGLTSWTIAGDTGSIRLSPVPGAGYTIG